MSAKQRNRRGRLRWLRPAVVYLLAGLVTLGAKAVAGTAAGNTVPVVRDWDAFFGHDPKQLASLSISDVIESLEATIYSASKHLHEDFPDKYPPPEEYTPSEEDIRFLEMDGCGDTRTPTKAARMIYLGTAISFALLTVICVVILWALRLVESRQKEFAKIVETHELELKRVETELEERSREKLETVEKDRKLAVAEAMVAIRGKVRLSEQGDELAGQVVDLTEQVSASRVSLKEATERGAKAEQALQETHELELKRVETELEERSREKLETVEKDRKLAVAEAMVAIRGKVRLSEQAAQVRARRDELAGQVVDLTEQANASRGRLEEATERGTKAEEALQESLKTIARQAEGMEVVLGEERAKLATEVKVKEHLKNLLAKETKSKFAMLEKRGADVNSVNTELEKARRDHLLFVEETKKRAEAERVAVNQAQEKVSTQHQRELEEQRTELVKLRAELKKRDHLLFVEKGTQSKLKAALQAISMREAEGANNAPANASLTRRVEVLEAQLAVVNGDLQSAIDAKQAAACAKSVAVDDAECLQTQLGWANKEIWRLRAEMDKAKESGEGKGRVEDSPGRVKVLEAQLAGVSGELQSANDAKRAAACAKYAAVDDAQGLQTQLGWANKEIWRLRAEMDKAKESGEGKGCVGDSPAKDVEPAPYFCCVAGCTVSRRGRYFHHGSGPDKMVCCPGCYVGLKGGLVVVFPGRPVLKADLKRHDGDQYAESALFWRRGNFPDYTGLYNPKNWCGLICVVQALFKWAYFERKAIMAKREEEAKKNAPGPTQVQCKLDEAGPQQSGEKSEALLSLLGALLKSMRNAEQGATPKIPKAIIEKLGVKALLEHKQTDAAKVLSKTLEVIAGEAGANQTGIGIGNEVEGKTRTKYRCDCSRVSEHKDEPFVVLAVPVSPLPVSSGKSKKKGGQGGSAARRSLVDLLVKFFGKSPVEGRCSGCNGSRAKTNKMSSTATLTKAPSKLFIQLNRAHYDSDQQQGRKVTDKVDIPLVLDLGSFMPRGEGNAVYDVDTTVHHLGTTPDSGHYTMYARVEGRVWCRFNDDKTTTVGTDQALAEGVYLVSYTKRP